MSVQLRIKDLINQRDLDVLELKKKTEENDLYAIEILKLRINSNNKLINREGKWRILNYKMRKNLR